MENIRLALMIDYADKYQQEIQIISAYTDEAKMYEYAVQSKRRLDEYWYQIVIVCKIMDSMKRGHLYIEKKDAGFLFNNNAKKIPAAASLTKRGTSTFRDNRYREPRAAVKRKNIWKNNYR